METKPFYPCPVRDQGEPVNNDESLKDRFEPMTNADRIRGMTDEALAKFLMSRNLTCRKCFFERRNRKDPTGVCWECTLAYLRRSPVEESEK